MKSCLVLFFLFLVCIRGYAEKLNDNSFLIEEGYNQEENVIQHIFAIGVKDIEALSSSYTEEWPLSGQSHQLSLSINWGDYIGDLLINYRYQLLLNEVIAFAPRISIIFPTADKRFSEDGSKWGLESNMPVSIDVSKRIAVHLNAGVRYDITQGKTEFVAGGSYVFVILKYFELLNEYIFSFEDSGKKSFVTGAGFRSGIDLKDNFQIVPGIGFYRDVSLGLNFIFLYLSAEHSI